MGYERVTPASATKASRTSDRRWLKQYGYLRRLLRKTLAGIVRDVKC